MEGGEAAGERRDQAAYAASNSTFSIKVASSASARELFTRFDTGHVCGKSFGGGLRYSRPASPPKRKTKANRTLKKSFCEGLGV